MDDKLQKVMGEHEFGCGNSQVKGNKFVGECNVELLRLVG